MNNFQDELKQLINKYSKENESNTPDWMLAEYLCVCLSSFNQITKARDKWWDNKSLEAFAKYEAQ